MASRLKEDEKNERSIRNLLKLPENRRCINCNSLGPQYVCTNFSTFVCTPCSGIHREFTHRVKSVSMAKFTPQEVSALQGGGNASAREIYLKEWDSQRNSLPDGSNIDRLRDFIKHVYVDRRYTGERSVEKPPRAKGETEDFTGNSRRDTYQGGSRSPPYDDTFERRYGDRPSSGGRSPSYDQGNRQSSDYKKSPAREVINDWRREDRFGNDRRSEERSSHGSSNLEIRSPDHRKDSDISSPPLVRPVRDILGDNVSPLRVIEPPPKSIGATSTDGRAPPAQRTASSSSLASSDVNPSDIKVEASFIDFDAIPEPPTSTVQQAQMAGNASSVPPTTSSSNDWANFDSLPEMKTAIPASNSMESILSGLSVPASSSGSSVPRGTLSSFQFAGVQGSSLGSSSGSTSAPSAIPSGVAPVSSFGSVPTNATTGGQWPTMNPQQQSLFPGGIEQPVSGGSSSYKSWNPHIPNTHGPPGAYFAQVGQAGAASGSTVESTRGRKALPEDLFAMNYSYSPSPVSGWYAGTSYVARVPMHYNMPKAVANFQAIPTSNNPFDVNEPSPVQASAFPSMASLQGALPRTATPPGVLHNQNYGASPYAPPVLAKTPPYAATISSSSFMGQGIAGGSMAPSARPQGLPIFSPEESGFAYLYPNPQAGGLHPAAQPASSNLSFTNGNPFG